jgi:hypothetical protein
MTTNIAIKYVKYFLSSGLTMTYIIYIFWGIGTNQAVLPGPAGAHFIIFLFCMTLVAYLEGLQVAILACEHLDPEPWRASYPRAFKLMSSVKQGNNVERFLVGRQFFTIFVMTLMAQVTSFPAISHLGIPSVVWFIFIQTGLPGAMVVTTVGSLQPQLLAAKDPWKFLDLYGTNAVLNLCYGLEISGVCTHFAWMLINILRNTAFRSAIPLKSHNKESTLLDTALEGLKYIVSCSVICVYFSYLMFGIWTNQAVLPVPQVAVFIIFCLCILFLAHLEGLQVAILVQENKDLVPYAVSHPTACSLMERATFEKNVRRFLIGRQFFVIFVVFLINQCTIFPTITHFGINGAVWFIFIQLGLPTALVVLCLGQLPAQLLGNHDPMLFMNRYGPRSTLEVCLFTELTGLAHFSWVVAAFSRVTWFRPSKDRSPALKLETTPTSDMESNSKAGVAVGGELKAKQSDVEDEEEKFENHVDVSHYMNDDE